MHTFKANEQNYTNVEILSRTRNTTLQLYASTYYSGSSLHSVYIISEILCVK